MSNVLLNREIRDLTAEMRQTFHSSYLPYVDNLANGTEAQFKFAKENVLQMFPQYKNHIDELYKIRFIDKVQAVNNLTEAGDKTMREALAQIDTIQDQLNTLRGALAQNFFISGGNDNPHENLKKDYTRMNKLELQNEAMALPDYSADLTKAELIALLETSNK